MARRSKRIAAANKAQEPPSKKQKLSKAEASPDRSLASTQKRGTAKKPIDGTTSGVFDKIVSNSESQLPAINNDNNKLKLDTLPAEIQQQIYWLAIEEYVLPSVMILNVAGRSTAHSLIRVSSSVQGHILKAVEVWGCDWMKNFVKCLKWLLHRDMEEGKVSKDVPTIS